MLVKVQNGDVRRGGASKDKNIRVKHYSISFTPNLIASLILIPLIRKRLEIYFFKETIVNDLRDFFKEKIVNCKEKVVNLDY